MIIKWRMQPEQGTSGALASSYRGRKYTVRWYCTDRVRHLSREICGDSTDTVAEDSDNVVIAVVFSESEAS